MKIARNIFGILSFAVLCALCVPIDARRFSRRKKKQMQALQQQVDIAESNTNEREPELESSPEDQSPVDADQASTDEHDQSVREHEILTQDQVSAEQEGDEEQKKDDQNVPAELRHVEPVVENQPTEDELLHQADDIEQEIEFHFEDTDLIMLIKQIEELFEVHFITDEMIQPMSPEGKALKGNKISFKTNRPLSRRQAWDLFLTFLEISGFGVVPDASPDLFRIKTLKSALRSPIPAFIGVDYTTLPDNDSIIRYVYFVENSTVDAIKNIIDPLRSTSSSLILLHEHKAFILTDKAYNIKTLMKIVKELDRVSMPQSMSVLKLKRTDANQVKALYDSLTQSDDKNSSRLFSAHKQPTSMFLPENTVIIAEPRTNSLILLGPQNAIEKIEDFIVKNIDVELDRPYSPLYTYQLKYADAKTVVDIMNNLSQFGKDTEAGKSGGVRGKDKYLSSVSFTAEEKNNRVIIRGNYDDYIASRDIIEKLDEPQPQVAIEVLILAVTVVDTRQLGAQIRSKGSGGTEGLLGNNVKWQTSGLTQTGGIVENKDSTVGNTRLLGDLISLATGLQAGNTVLTMGSDAFGVWGIFQALQTVSNTQVISNPFITATNKTPAKIALGQIRRVQTGSIVGTNVTDTLSDDAANLEVTITPQINSDGMILLNLVVNIEEFLNANTTDATKSVKKITTSTIVADKEVLALGGLVRNNISNSLLKVPWLADVPVLGWFFKNKSKVQDKENLLILISTQIITPDHEDQVKKYTQMHIDDYYGTLSHMHDVSEKRDPIHKMFFAANKVGTENLVDNYLFKRKDRKSTAKPGGESTGGASSVDTMETNGVVKNVENKKIKSKGNGKKEHAKELRVSKRSKQHAVDSFLNAQEKPVTVTQSTKNAPAPSSKSERIDVKTKKRTKLALTDFLKNTDAGLAS